MYVAMHQILFCRRSLSLEVAGSLIVVSEEKDFELCAVCDGEPVHVSEDRGDMVTGTGVCVSRRWSSGYKVY